MYFDFTMYIAIILKCTLQFTDTLHDHGRTATTAHRSYIITNTTEHNPTCGLDHVRTYCQLLMLPTLLTFAKASKAVPQAAHSHRQPLCGGLSEAPGGTARPTYLPN